MFLRKILGRFLTTDPKKQELSSQQPLQVSAEPGQQLELIAATPSLQQHPQQMILTPWDNCISIHQTSSKNLINPNYHIPSILTLLSILLQYPQISQY